MIKEFEFKDHQEWLSIRKNYIGGSDAGAVIGMNPYKSAYTLWAEKTGKIAEFEGNLTTKVGAYLEDLVAKLFEEETGKKVQRKNRTLVNDQYPFACANIDRRVVGEKAFVEIKTTNSFPIMKQLRGTEFPDAYYAQVVHYLAVTGLEKAYLAVLVNCREFKVYELERDQEEIDALMKAEAEFWRLVVEDVPPAVDGADSTSETLKTLYPESTGENIDLMGVAETLAEYTALKAYIDIKKEELAEKENIIKDYMRTAERGEYGIYKVSYKSQAGRTSFDSKAFMKDYPSLDYSKYITTGKGSRPFKVTIKEEK